LYKLGGLLYGLGSPHPASMAVAVNAIKAIAKSEYFMKISFVIKIKNCLSTNLMSRWNLISYKPYPESNPALNYLSQKKTFLEDQMIVQPKNLLKTRYGFITNKKITYS
jgi:hypothetical protein